MLAMEAFMANYSIAQAKDHLAELVSAAEAGETVTITRQGKPVAVLKAVSDSSAGVTRQGPDPRSFDLIKEQLGQIKWGKGDPLKDLNDMRDEF
jgi:prevent-host-death family protein